MSTKDQLQPSVDLIKEPQHTESLTKHQKAIIDYSMEAATAANRVQTEELSTRMRHTIHNEIQGAFETYSKITTSRKVWMGIGAALTFGLGYLVNGWLGGNRDEDDEPQSNGMND